MFIASVRLEERMLTTTYSTAKLLPLKSIIQEYSRASIFPTFMSVKKALIKPTNRLLNGFLTSLSMKSDPGIILSIGLKKDAAHTGSLEKQVPVNRH